MKKLAVSSCIMLLVLLLMVGVACQKENIEKAAPTESENSSSMSVAEAKTWFDQNQQPELTLKSEKLKGHRMKPEWGKSLRDRKDKFDVVETEIQVQGGVGFAAADAYSAWENTKNPLYMNSVSRLVVLKDGESGEKVSFIMTIVADKNYLEKKKFNLKDSYFRRDKELSGYVFYHNMNGEFVNGWVYENGKVTGEFNMDDNIVSLEDHLKSACQTVYMWTQWIVTSSWSSMGYFGSETSYQYTVYQTIDCNFSQYTYNPSDGQKDLSKLTYKGTSGGYAPKPVPEILQTPEFNKIDKLICVYGTLKRTMTTNYNPLVTSFLINFTEGLTINPGDLVFDAAPLVGKYGNTNRDVKKDKYIVTINSNEVYNRAPIELAKTFIHEILHAQLAHNSVIAGTTFIDYFRDYVRVVKKVTYVNDHQLMLEQYIPPMVRFLRDFDSQTGQVADEQYYRAIALSGVDLNLTQEEYDAIISASDYFRQRGLECK